MSPSEERVNAVIIALHKSRERFVAEKVHARKYTEVYPKPLSDKELIGLDAAIAEAVIAAADATRPKLEVTDEMIDGAASAMWSVAMNLRADAPYWEELDNNNRAWYMNMAKRMLEAALKVTE